MRVERTFNLDIIKSIVEHPELRDLLTEDGEVVHVPSHPDIYWLLSYNKDILRGFVGFIPINSITWNPHIAILPEFRGCGTDTMYAGIQWMFQNTPCQKIVAYPPGYNKAMIRVFEKCGLHREGLSPDSFMFRGKVYDRILMGIERS